MWTTTTGSRRVDEQVPGQLTKLGSGSFGAVYNSVGTNLAFKEVHNPEHSSILKSEFLALNRLFKQCYVHGFFFRVPRPFACHLPDHLNANGKFSETFSIYGFVRATYAMEMVPNLPAALAHRLRSYYPPGTPTTAAPPNLSRLYFGKETPPPDPNRRPNLFFSSSNFPLTAEQYGELVDEAEECVDVEEVVDGMGEMLARIHWGLGYDARDIEWVMGGDSNSQVMGAVGYYLIDFNQVSQPCFPGFPKEQEG